MPSISYYVTLALLQISGIKKQFATVPIAYKTLRKGTVRQPKSAFLKRLLPQVQHFLAGELTQLKPKNPSGRLAIIYPGGAYVYGPTLHQWDLAERIVKMHGHEVWMANYPKAPEHSIAQLSAFNDHVYERALAEFPAENIRLVGDSAGGGLMLSTVQRAIAQHWKLPAKIVAISPVADVQFKNPKSLEVEKRDVLLSLKGAESAQLFCGDTRLDDPMISPIYGSFKGFPPTVIFIAQYDITSPDQWELVKTMRRDKVEVQVDYGEKMPHIWPLFPFMHEALQAKKRVLEALR